MTQPTEIEAGEPSLDGEGRRGLAEAMAALATFTGQGVQRAMAGEVTDLREFMAEWRNYRAMFEQAVRAEERANYALAITSGQVLLDRAVEQIVEERATAEARYQALLRHWEFGQIPRDDYGRKYGVTITDTASFLRESDRVNAAVRAALLPASPVPAPAPTDEVTK